MKTINVFIALVLVAGLALSVGTVPVAQAATTVVLGGSVATLVGAQSTSSEQYIGNGSWYSVLGDSKIELYIDPTSPPYDGLGSFTIADIEKVSYVTKNGGTPSGVDFYVNIYTMPYSGGDASWYGNRLTLEPLYANNYNAPNDTWNTWTTDSGTNQLTLFDSNHGPYGFYGAPTLADIQAGPITWSDYVPSGDTTPIDYKGQTVKYIVLATGSGWANVFEGFVDALTIELKTGPSLTIDLEHHPSEVWVDDDWASTVPGTDPDGAGPATSFGYDAFATIQEGIDAVSGSTVNVAAGTYNESVTIDKDNLTVLGDSSSQPVITGGLKLDTDLTGLTFKNFYVSGSAVPENSVVRMFGAITDLSIDNCVFDGENVSGRLGFSGGQFEGDVTVTNSEFKNILGWALFESRSGSGGDGSAMDTVTFAGNNIHHSNGSVVFRGLSTDRTDLVNVYGNTWSYIGGNNAETGQHWAALEVNRSVEVNVYDNTVDHVSLGQWGEGQAFQFWNIDTLLVYDNDITNNAQGIFIYGDGSGALGGPFAVPGGYVSCNNIVNNAAYGLDLDPAATGGPLNAENNWWGDASGPTHPSNSGGSGDAVSDNVDFDPWATSTPPCEPTAITLASFTAQVGANGVTLAWETGTEIDNAGFNLYRAMTKDGPYTQINDALIAAEGDAVSGGSYSFVDTPDYGTFYYKLEDVDYYGVSTLHGPVKVTVARPLRRPLYRPTLPEF